MTVYLAIIFLFVSLQTQSKFEELTGFNNPGAIAMFTYTPKGISKNAPVVILIHGCQQRAKDFALDTGWKAMADQLGLILLLPEQSMKNNGVRCFSWFENEDIIRDHGETASIASAIDALEAKLAIDTHRVFVAGLSAGATMAAALMASYPEKIKAGALISSVSYGCALRPIQSLYCMLTPPWKSSYDRGQYVRDASEIYNSDYPKVTVIHGARDPFVSILNSRHSVAQWTNVHGTDSRVDGLRQLRYSNHLMKEYKVRGVVAVEELIIRGAGHGWPVATKQGCGSVGKFVIEAGVCLTSELSWSWQLAKRESQLNLL